MPHREPCAVHHGLGLRRHPGVSSGRPGRYRGFPSAQAQSRGGAGASAGRHSGTGIGMGRKTPLDRGTLPGSNSERRDIGCLTARWSRRRGPDAGAPRLIANVSRARAVRLPSSCVDMSGASACKRRSRHIVRARFAATGHLGCSCERPRWRVAVPTPGACGRHGRRRGTPRRCEARRR